MCAKQEGKGKQKKKKRAQKQKQNFVSLFEVRGAIKKYNLVGFDDKVDIKNKLVDFDRGVDVFNELVGDEEADRTEHEREGVRDH